MTKRPSQVKSLSVEDYLAYKAINKQYGFNSDEMELFLIDHNLPTRSELCEEDLFLCVTEHVPVIIYNIREKTNSKEQKNKIKKEIN